MCKWKISDTWNSLLPYTQILPYHHHPIWSSFGTHTLPHHTAIRVTLAFSSNTKGYDGSFVIISLPLAFLFKPLDKWLSPRMLKSISEHVASLLRIFSSSLWLFGISVMCHICILCWYQLHSLIFFKKICSVLSPLLSLCTCYSLFLDSLFLFCLDQDPWVNFSYFFNPPWDNVGKNFNLRAFHWWIIEILWNMNGQWNVIKARHLAYVPMVKYLGKQEHLWFREKWVSVKV